MIDIASWTPVATSMTYGKAMSVEFYADDLPYPLGALAKRRDTGLRGELPARRIPAGRRSGRRRGVDLLGAQLGVRPAHRRRAQPRHLPLAELSGSPRRRPDSGTAERREAVTPSSPSSSDQSCAGSTRRCRALAEAIEKRQPRSRDPRRGPCRLRSYPRAVVPSRHPKEPGIGCGGTDPVGIAGARHRRLRRADALRGRRRTALVPGTRGLTMTARAPRGLKT